MNETIFQNSLKELGLTITEKQLEQFHIYYEMLNEWNQKFNLTALTKKEDVYLKHFYDSLCIVRIVNLNEIATICDIGTGAGFPGVVLKIMFPKLKLTLVDSLNKRIIFLRELCEKLGLIDIEYEHARAEDFAKINRERFELVVARAVAPLPILLEYTIPLVKKGKYFLAMKGDISREIKDAEYALSILNTHLLKQETFVLPIEGSHRSLVLFQKDKETKLTYPRKPEQIKKRPLIK